MKKEVILCVDDEKIILDSLKAQLKNNFGNKYTYEFAENADEALELLDELNQDSIKVNLVVTDWLMPGMKGDGLLIEIHKRYPDIIKIMLTGQADKSAIENAFKNANLYKFLAKPWNEIDLIETVKKGLSGSV